MAKLKDVLKDVGKAVVKAVAVPVNAITGHEFNPVMTTKLGNKLEKAGDFMEDVITQGVNTATFGLAKKTGLFDGEIETKAGKVVGQVAGVAGLAAATLATGGAVAGAGFSVKAGAAAAAGVVKKVGAENKAEKQAAELVKKMDALDASEGWSAPGGVLPTVVEAAAGGAGSPVSNAGMVKESIGSGLKTFASSVLTSVGASIPKEVKDKVNGALGALGLGQTDPVEGDNGKSLIWILLLIAAAIMLFRK